MLEFLKACIITVVIETAFFAVLAYRKRDDLLIVVLANVITNLSLNLFIYLVPAVYSPLWLFLLEALVVAVEYLIYRKAFGGSLGLFLMTLAANVLSFSSGLLLQHLGLW